MIAMSQNQGRLRGAWPVALLRCAVISALSGVCFEFALKGFVRFPAETSPISATGTLSAIWFYFAFPVFAPFTIPFGLTRHCIAALIAFVLATSAIAFAIHSEGSFYANQPLPAFVADAMNWGGAILICIPFALYLVGSVARVQNDRNEKEPKTAPHI